MASGCLAMDSNGIHGENHGENKRYSPGIPMDHWRFDPGSYWVKGRHIYLGRCVLVVFPVRLSFGWSC